MFQLSIKSKAHGKAGRSEPNSFRCTVGGILLAGIVAVPANAQEIVANSNIRYLGATSSLLDVPVAPGNSAVVAADHQGNLIVVDTGRGLVSRVPLQGGAPTTLATGISGISAVTVDVQGDVYVASTVTNQVTELPARGGAARTIATGLNHPSSLTIDPQGNIIIADTGNNRVFSVTPGSGTTQLSNNIAAPTAVFADASGDVFVGGKGSLTLLAANGQVVSLGQNWSQPTAILQTATRDLYIVDNGGTTLTKLNYVTVQPQAVISAADTIKPFAIAGDNGGNLYVFDQSATHIVKLDPSLNLGPVAVGTQSAQFTLTYAFQGQLTLGSILDLTQGNADGQLTTTGGTCHAGSTYQPGSTCTVAIALTPKQAGRWNGDLTVLDNSGNDLLDIQLFAQGVAPVQTLLPGLATSYFRDPYVYESELLPSSLAVDAADNVYIGDDGNRRVLRVAPDGTSSVVLAGNEARNDGLRNPLALTLDGKGNLFIADQSYAFGISPNLGAASSDNSMNSNPFVAVPYAQWGYGQQFVEYMTGLVVQPSGGFIFSDSTNNRVIAVDPDGYGVEILNSSSVIGSEKQGISYPLALALEADGSLLVADFGNARVVRRTRDGVVSDVVAPGAAIAGEPLVQPMGLAVDPAGNIYIADAGNDRVVAISPQGNSWVVIDDTFPVDASTAMPISDPQTLAIDSHGNLYIADMGNERVVKLSRSAENLVFNQTNVGSQSAPVFTTIQNTGNSALSLESISLSGSPTFSLLPATTCQMQTTLAAGSSCVVQLAYSPVSDGNNQGQINIVSNTQAGTAVATAISLYGTTHPLVDHLRLVKLPPSAAAGSPFSYILRAEDPQGNPVTGYRGTVQILWSSAASAGAQTATVIQTAQYTFTVADAGVHAVANTVLNTAGVDTLAISDTQNTALTVSGQVIISAGPAAALAVVSGAGQSATPHQPFAQPVVVQVTDAYGNLVAGAQISFTSPNNSAGATDSNGNSIVTAFTDGTGNADVQFVANNKAGTYTVTASVQGAPSATFSLTNLPVGFTMTATPTTTSFSAAGQASIVLNVVPVAGFTGNITLSCQQANGASCSFSNSNLQIQSNSEAATAVDTAAADATIPVQVTINNMPSEAPSAATAASAAGQPLSAREARAVVMVCGLAGVFGLARIRRYRSALGVVAMCMLLLTGSMTLSGCAGNAAYTTVPPSSPTSPGTPAEPAAAPVELIVVAQTTLPGMAQPFQQSVTVTVNPYASAVTGGTSTTTASASGSTAIVKGKLMPRGR